TGDDLQILASVASQAQISIENAQLHSESVQQARLQRELEFAREVQKGFLPRETPRFGDYLFWAFYEAAGQVGGDYYDFVFLPNGRLAVILGDVSGKGVPAALMMAKVSSDTKVALLTLPDDPAAAMEMINESVCAAGLEGKFMTMSLCIIDPRTNVMTIVNAGHMSPIIRSGGAALHEPADDEHTGLPVGVMEGMSYVSVDYEIQPGDSVVIFSDGISEAMNARADEYSTDRLRKRIKEVDMAPAALGEYVLRDVREHVAGYKQSDDISMVVFGRAAIPPATVAGAGAGLTSTPPSSVPTGSYSETPGQDSPAATMPRVE
ncbi:MAG: PP2C family protein-serine/threonine phosphatase, partial [Planctomycetia bacterium]